MTYENTNVKEDEGLDKISKKAKMVIYLDIRSL